MSALRVCEHCHKEFYYTVKTQLFCTPKCKQQYQYDLNKNPFSITDLTESTYQERAGTYGDYYVPPEILAQAELYTDCAADFEVHLTGAFYEDMEDLNMILRSEYALSEAKYEKRAKARYSGKNYWAAKMLKSYHRKRAGANKLSSIRYENFELRALKLQQEKRGEIPKHPVTTEAQIENPGFVTITPMRTKSGKLISEILDYAKRKKSVGST